MRMKGFRRWAVAAVLGLRATTSWAAPGAEEVAVAQQLYQEARQSQEQKQWASCETALKRAIAILETPGLRFHLAFCKEQQHRWVEALVDYRRAQELIDGGVEADDVAQLLPGAIANLEEQTPRLSLIVDEPPADTQLYLDGKKVSVELLGTPIPVDPGLRRVEVAAPGHVAFTQAINLLAKDRRELRVELVPDESQVEPSAPALASGQSVAAPNASVAVAEEPSRTASMGAVLAVEGVLTLVAVGIGVGFSMEAQSREEDRDTLLQSIPSESACSGGRDEHPLCQDVRLADADARSDRDIALMGYAAGGVGAVALLVTWLVWPEPEPEAASRGVQLLATPQLTGLGYSGVF